MDDVSTLVLFLENEASQKAIEPDLENKRTRSDSVPYQSLEASLHLTFFAVGKYIFVHSPSRGRA